MKFFTLIHINPAEQSTHNNAGGGGFKEQINLYLSCAMQLHRSLQAEGIELIVLTNNASVLQSLNTEKYPIEIRQLQFTSEVPSGIKFYSAHYKLEVFDYLASLEEDYIALVDADMICINKLPAAFRWCIEKRIPLYYDITDQVTPAYTAKKIIADKELINEKPSLGLWAGGEFLAGPPSFFQVLSTEVGQIKRNYFKHFSTLHHQGDEVLTSVSIENIKTVGSTTLFDAGLLSIVGRYWSFVPLHVQKQLSAYQQHFLLHLPSDKRFLSRLNATDLKGQSFFKKYSRHVSVSRIVEKTFKSIKPYAKQLRRKFAR